MQYTFDTRAAVLGLEIDESWELALQEQWRANQASVREGLLLQLGPADGDRKIADVRALGSAPWSLIAAHNAFVAQIRLSFAAGAYYPALLGAAGLGERILNDLVRDLRGDYASHPSTAAVRGRESFDNWPRTIGVLRDWGVLGDEAAADYLALGRARNAAVHYMAGLERDVRDAALDAIGLLQRLVEALFTPLGAPPLFIPGVVGASFLSREAEALPFVRRYYLPNSVLVSPRYEMRFSPDGQQFECLDDAEYEPAELTDAEFAAAVGGGGTRAEATA